MKKLVALLLALMIMMTACFAVAHAGSIFNTIGNLAKSAVHVVTSAGKAAYGVVECAVTDKTMDECMEGARKEIYKSKDNIVDAWDSTKKIGTDLVDLGLGAVKATGGLVAAAGTAIYETAEGVTTGNWDYSKSSEFIDMAKDGYKQADNGIFMDMATIAATVCGVPVVAVSAAQLGKSLTEVAVDYKTWDESKETIINSAVGTVTGGVVTGANLGGYVATKVATTAISSGTQIALDLTNDKETRSAWDVVIEDTAAAAAKTAVMSGVKAAGDACRGGNAAANQPAAENQAAAENNNAANDAAGNASGDAASNAAVDANSVGGGSADTVSVDLDFSSPEIELDTSIRTA